LLIPTRATAWTASDLASAATRAGAELTVQQAEELLISLEQAGLMRRREAGYYARYTVVDLTEAAADPDVRTTLRAAEIAAYGIDTGTTHGKIVEVLVESGRAMDGLQIARAIERDGRTVTRSELRAALNWLARHGFVVQAGLGRYRPARPN